MEKNYKIKTVLLAGICLFILSLTNRTEAQVLGAPVLASPANGATNQPTSIILQWNSVLTATSYSVQAATDPSFSNLVVDQSGLTGTSFSVSGLSNNVTYYWRAGTSTLILFSPWSSVWSFTTAAPLPPALTAPALISPVDGSSNQSTSITFSWSQVTNATNYHFQLSTTSSFSSLVSDNSGLSGTTTQVSSLLSGQVYYWRVSANNANSTGPWSSVLSFTTVVTSPPPVLAAPALVSPPDSSTNVPTSVNFSWSSIKNATDYHFQLSKSPAYDSLIVNDSALPQTSKRVDSLGSNQNYYWRVNAKNSGNDSPWSESRSLKTTSSPSSTLASPSLVSPPNGSVNQATTLLLQWTSVSGASSYSVQVASDAAFNNIIIDQSNLTNTFYQLTGLTNNTTYYWRTGATSLILFSGWSSIWNFTTAPASNILTAPVLNSPANGSVNQPLSLTLSWNTVSGAGTYKLQVATDSLFNSLVFNNGSLSAVSQQVSNLIKNTVYYWHVSAANSQGSSSFSSTWNFKTFNDSTSSLPSVPVLLTPGDSSVNDPLYPILSWSKSTGADFYKLQISTDETFTNIVFDDSLIAQTYYQAGQLNQNTKYFWRVNARNGSGTSQWSSIWNFVTQKSTSTVPVLVSPTDGSSNQPLSVACVWDTVSKADVYNLQVATSPDFSTLYFDDSTVSNTSEIVGSLVNGSKYFWRVRAKINGGWNVFSSAWQFTTRVTLPAYLNVDTTITFPSYPDLSKFKSTDYKLIGLPGASNIPVSALLSGSNGKDWDAYWDNGASNNFLIEYGNANNFIFSTGTAYWIIKNGTFKIDTTIENAPLNSKGYVEIPLRTGWNLITDPFVSEISWLSIKSRNKITDPVYSFNGAFQISETLAPFNGYYFFNSGNLSTLEIAPSDSSRLPKGNTAMQKFPGDDGWYVNISLDAGSYSDSAAWFGTSSSAASGYNTFDIHKPRNTGSIPEIYFKRTEWDKDYPVFASDIKPPFNNYEEWNFTVNSGSMQSAKLTFNGLEQVPDLFDVFLYNQSTNKWTNLRKSNSYQFIPSNPVTRFKVVVGTKEAIKDKIGGGSQEIPNSITLGNNYPNPFNNSTVIPVTIPSSSNVAITVYNIIGRQIKTIYQGPLDAGEHLFNWDGTDNNGSTVSSGIYFYRLIASPNVSQIKKMILLK